MGEMPKPVNWIEDEFFPCSVCGEEHPIGVLEVGICPSCCDDWEGADVQR